MADDDLDMLQELLELAEDNDHGAHASAALHQDNVRPEAQKKGSRQKEQSKGGTTEKFSGLRMTNVCFPSIVLKERLADIQFCKLSQVRNKSSSDNNWATVATVAEMTTKESAKGQAYIIWRLTDLQGTNISFFLFKDAQSGLWKEPVGAVVAVFKPQIRSEDGKFSLSVDSEQQVVKLGTSMDLGFCGAKKKDGTPCRNAVNISTCPYCDYHVQSQYNKIRSKRSELKDNRLHNAFHYTNGARLGATNVPNMTESGERLVPKVPTLRKNSQHEMQRIAERASKTIPGAARYLGSAMPGQQAADTGRLQPASKAPAYGPMTKVPAKQAKRTAARHAEIPNKRSRTDAQGTAEAEDPNAQPGMLVLQDDEVDWENQAQDASLQQALAIIKAKGGLVAPDPNRPFDSRSHLQRAAVKPNAPSRQLAQQHENQDSPSPLQPLNTAGLAGRPHQQGQQSQQGQSSSLPSSSGARTHEANKVQLQQLQDQSQRRQASADASGIGAGTSEALGVQQEQQSVLQRTTDAPLSKAASNNTSVSGRQLAPAGPQDGVLAKLGLGRKPGQTLQASSHISQAHSAAAPSGFATAFGSITAGKDADHTNTRYKDLVDDEEHDRQMRVLAALEKKDEMQQRMEAVTKLNVTAFQCSTCKCTTERRKPECRQHDVQRVTATKRWWICCHCNNRSHTLAVRLPMQRCPKCNDPGMEFKAASMGRAVKENTDPGYASRAGFKARGVEHAFGLNGMV